MQKVLIVSYDLSVLSVARQILLDQFDVLTTDDGTTAFALLRDFKGIDAVICDTKASNMTGLDFLAEASQIVPGAAIVLMTDQTDDAARKQEAAAPPSWRRIEKPLDGRSLLAVLDRSPDDTATPPGSGSFGKETLQDALSKTDPDHEFSMVYQPRICAKTEKTCAVEAFVRWNSSKLGAVPPAEFIPVAEETGDILWITDWTLQTACKAARDWIDQGNEAIPVSVNVSPKVYTDARLVALVANAIRVSGIPAHLLELELTEGLNVFCLHAARQSAEGLNALGIRVSVDGINDDDQANSELAPGQAECLRGGHALIGRFSSTNREKVLQPIRELGRKLGIKTVAAGVENLQHVEFIRSLGFDQMQGFLISEPLGQADLGNWLKTRALT